MNFIFFGTPEFAAIILEKLINAKYIPAAIVCNPDKPFGRKKIITPPPTKILAQKYNIPIWQPEKLNNYSITQLLNYKPDFFIVAAYAKIIPKKILEIPRLGTIGVHPSLLPKYRGSSPIQTAIIDGEKETGSTLYLMDEKTDHGKIVSSIKYQISDNDNYEILMKKLAELSADLLINFLRNYENIRKYEKIIGVPQNESQATYTKKFTTEDAFVEPEDLEIARNEFINSPQIAIEIDRKIRALNPEPGIFTIINGQRVKLLEAKIQDNKLKLVKIQKSGKKPINLIEIK